LDSRGRLAFLSLQDEEAAPLLAPLPDDERLASWRLVQSDRVVGRGEAAAELLELLLPGSGRLARRLPLEAGYGLVARNRDRLGRFVPDGPAIRRYP
jgi:predicted DCC family thiol-disulfide oxidoreductase YuxK